MPPAASPSERRASATPQAGRLPAAPAIRHPAARPFGAQARRPPVALAGSLTADTPAAAYAPETVLARMSRARRAVTPHAPCPYAQQALCLIRYGRFSYPLRSTQNRALSGLQSKYSFGHARERHNAALG